MRSFARRDPDQVASAIVEVEVVRTIRRLVPELAAQARRVVAQLTVVDATVPIRARASDLEPATLRPLDALHLATALELGDELDGLVTYDARMSTAAEKLGLVVWAPV